jgi:glutamyl-tRNA synthetase
MNAKPRVRFAPSPTGHLHIGSLRTALFNWLFARHTGGSFLMRIEDTDVERSRDEYTRALLESLDWMGIISDEPLVTQSQRGAEYNRLAHELVAQGKAYICYCSSEDLVQRIGQNTAQGAYTKYDCYCREKGYTVPNSGILCGCQTNSCIPCSNQLKEKSDCQSGSSSLHGTCIPLCRPYVIRFKVPDDRKEIIFNDMVYGPMTFERDILDDFIIIRSGGYPMYNFAVVVDDILMNITHIIRGQEHLINTPKQILLYEALNVAVPLFAHLPLILGADGRKLSKREAATAVNDYRKAGFVPDALLNYLVRLGWSHGDVEVVSREELITLFSLNEIGKNGAIFDGKKLAWLNSVYMKAMSVEALWRMIQEDIPAYTDYVGQQIEEKIGLDRVYTALKVYRERTDTLAQLFDAIRNIWAIRHFEGWKDEGQIEVITGDPFDPVGSQEQQTTTHTIVSDPLLIDGVLIAQRLESLLGRFEKIVSWDKPSLEGAVKEVCTQYSIGMGLLAKPVRLALVGTFDAPGVYDLLVIIGATESMARLHQLCACLRGSDS